MTRAAAAAAGGGAAAPHPTPAAEFEVLGKTREGRAAAFAWVAGDERIGAAAVCRADGRVQPALCFGFHPDGRPAQAAVLPLDRSGEAPSPPEAAGASAGCRCQLIEDKARVRKAVQLVFRNGALLSNGQNSIRNRIPDADNALARERMMERGDD